MGGKVKGSYLKCNCSNAATQTFHINLELKPDIFQHNLLPAYLEASLSVFIEPYSQVSVHRVAAIAFLSGAHHHEARNSLIPIAVS